MGEGHTNILVFLEQKSSVQRVNMKWGRSVGTSSANVSDTVEVKLTLAVTEL